METSKWYIAKAKAFAPKLNKNELELVTKPVTEKPIKWYITKSFSFLLLN